MKKLLLTLFAIAFCFALTGVVKADKTISTASGLGSAFWAAEPDPSGSGYGPINTKVDENTVTLLNSIVLKENLTFNLDEDVVFDLHGNSFEMNGYQITVNGGEHSIKITDSSETMGQLTEQTNNKDAFIINSGTIELDNINFDYYHSDFKYQEELAAFMLEGGRVNIYNSKTYTHGKTEDIDEHTVFSNGGTIDIKNSDISALCWYDGLIQTEDKNAPSNVTITNSKIYRENYNSSDAVYMIENKEHTGSTLTYDGGSIDGIEIAALKEKGTSGLSFFMTKGTITRGITISGYPKKVSISGGTFSGESSYSIRTQTSNLYNYIHPDYYLPAYYEAYGSYCWRKPGEVSIIPRKKKVVLNKTSFVYNGKYQRPSVTVYDLKGNKLVQNKDFKVSYSDWPNVGTWDVFVEYIGEHEGEPKDTLHYSITKANSPMKVTAKKKITLKYKTIKKKRWTQKIAITVKGYKCNWMTYKKVKGNKHLGVNQNAKSNKCYVYATKGIKKGTYKIKVKVTDVGNENYKGKSKTVTIKVKIK